MAGEAKKSEARKLAEAIARLDDGNCETCGKPLMNMTGQMARGSSEGWIRTHGYDERACQRAASVDHRVAYAIAESCLQRISEWAWLALEELEETEWEALPQSVKDALSGIYTFASDATSHRSYEGLCVDPYAPAQEPTSGEES